MLTVRIGTFLHVYLYLLRQYLVTFSNVWFSYFYGMFLLLSLDFSPLFHSASLPPFQSLHPPPLK